LVARRLLCRYGLLLPTEPNTPALGLGLADTSARFSGGGDSSFGGGSSSSSSSNNNGGGGRRGALKGGAFARGGVTHEPASPFSPPLAELLPASPLPGSATLASVIYF
jgi:hypothetical protein